MVAGTVAAPGGGLVGIVEIPDFRKRGGEPQRVTVVTPDAVDEFLGARSRWEREEFLRELRDRGLLITNRGRTLQQTIKRTPLRLAYVFVGAARGVPRIRRGTAPVGVMTWR